MKQAVRGGITTYALVSRSVKQNTSLPTAAISAPLKHAHSRPLAHNQTPDCLLKSPRRGARSSLGTVC